MDIIARVLTEQLARDVGTPFIVDNKRGAGGNVAVPSLLSSPADGRTIMIAIDNILTEILHVNQTELLALKGHQAGGGVRAMRHCPDWQS
jgi:tripartite-type tricarboxylate transporter receptor subunit TctC